LWDLKARPPPNRANANVGCTISVFYGVGRFSTYHRDLGKVVDHAYLNNKTHIEQNRSLDLANIHYISPAPLIQSSFGL